MLAFIAPAQAQTAEAIHAAQQAGDQLLGMGPFGALLLLLLLGAAIIITVLWRQSQGLLREIADLHKDRVKEATEQVKIVTGVATTSSATIAASTVALQGHSALLQDVLDVVRVQPASIETVLRVLERNGDKLDRALEISRSRP